MYVRFYTKQYSGSVLYEIIGAEVVDNGETIILFTHNRFPDLKVTDVYVPHPEKYTKDLGLTAEAYVYRECAENIAIALAEGQNIYLHKTPEECMTYSSDKQYENEFICKMDPVVDDASCPICGKVTYLTQAEAEASTCKCAHCEHSWHRKREMPATAICL